MYIFGLTLAYTILWIVLPNEGLWGKIMMAKYMKPKYTKDWLTKKFERYRGASIVWKTLVRVFPLIGKWLVYRIGKANNVKIDKDLCWGDQNHFLLYEVSFTPNKILELLKQQILKQTHHGVKIGSHVFKLVSKER